VTPSDLVETYARYGGISVNSQREDDVTSYTPSHTNSNEILISGVLNTVGVAEASGVSIRKSGS
jgi:hypothetical protein